MLDIEYRIQLSRIPAGIDIVIIRHDVRRQLWHAEPYVQHSAGRGALIETPIAAIVEVQEVRVVPIDQVLNAQHEFLDELRTRVVFIVRRSIEVTRVHAVPPLAFAVGCGHHASVGDALNGSCLIAAVADRHKLPPYPPRRAVISDSEPQSVGAGEFAPRAHNVLLGPHVHAIPRLVLRVPAIEVPMVVCKRDEILGPGPCVEPNEFLRVPVLRPPKMADVFVAELRRMAVRLDMVIVLSASLYVHAAGVPIPLLGNALRTPMRPDSEFRVAKPVGATVRFQRFPIGTKRTHDGTAGENAVGPVVGPFRPYWESLK